MDACNMSFENEKFDIIFDKATLDSIRCGMNFQFQVDQYLKEIRRVLKPEGIFICISHAKPFVLSLIHI